MDVPVGEPLLSVAAWSQFGYHKLDATVKIPFKEFGNDENGQIGTLARSYGIHQSGFKSLASRIKSLKEPLFCG